MPTFTPPLVPGPAPIGGRSHPLWRHYGNFDCGETIWKDPQGVWHKQQVPYLGGSSYRNFNDGILVSETFDDPNTSLANATEIYYGGSSYEITDSKADELRAAGFFVGGHWDSEELKWQLYAVNSDPNSDYKGGDACASLKRPTNESLWTFADNFIGTVNGFGFYISALPTHNALIVMDSSGVLQNQVFNGSNVAFPHADGSKWYWAIDIGGTNDGSTLGEDVTVACWEVTSGGNFGHLLQNTLITVGNFGIVSGTFNISHQNETFLVQDMYKDTAAGFHYILGLEYDLARGGYDNYSLRTTTYPRLARVPIGSLTNSASWEFWTGTAWSSNGLEAQRLKDRDGNPIRGDSCLTKVGSSYILASLSNIQNPILSLYTAPSPTGPWRFYANAGQVKLPVGPFPIPPSQSYAHYLPKFHEHLNPNPSTLVLTYNRNIFSASGPNLATLPLTSIHVSTFTPLFIYAPVPS